MSPPWAINLFGTHDWGQAVHSDSQLKSMHRFVRRIYSYWKKLAIWFGRPIRPCPAVRWSCIPQFNNSCLFIGLAGSCSCDVVDVYCSIHDFNWCSTLVVLITQYSAFPTLQKLRTSYAIDPTPWWIKWKNWFIYANHIAWKYFFPNWNALVSSNAGVA